MKIRLVSRDRHVEKICREGLARLCGTDWSLYLDPEGHLDVPVDLSILDLDAHPVPHQPPARNGTPEILVYSQEQLDAACGRLPDAAILLKPLQRELFLTVLGCALRRRRESVEQPAAAWAEAPPHEELLRLLQQASLELQRAHARQMHFLARGLHDLRAPLTAIEGYSGLLLAERFGPLTAAQRENLLRMQQSITRLSRMATDMFRLSLGERGEQAPELRPGDIEQCMERVLDEMMPLADAKQIRLAADIAAPAAPLCFDDAQIHGTLVNLIENACRFTPRGGSIEVRGYSVFWERRCPEVRETREHDRRTQESRVPNAYRVDIGDSGPGVPPEHLDSIFEPYTSYAGSQDRAGSGLGLAICRMAIGAHGGQIFVEPGGEGATFSFVLPFAETASDSGHDRSRPDDRPAPAGHRPPQPEHERDGWSEQIAEETA